jgi:hypothetical protein
LSRLWQITRETDGRIDESADQALML